LHKPRFEGARLYSSRQNSIGGLCNKGTASEPAEKLDYEAVLKGHGFIRADKSNKMAPALAAEGWFLLTSAGVRRFSATSSAGPITRAK
jgi:hypothetical protein